MHTLSISCHLMLVFVLTVILVGFCGNIMDALLLIAMKHAIAL